MEEEAKKELRMLEEQYPNRYECLKLELNHFISLLHSSHQATSQLIPTTTTTATTQESTSRRKKKKSTTTENYRSRYLVESIAEDQTGQELDDEKQKISKKRDRVEVVLERAHACLRKIKNFKASLLS
ncbi:uncharacterized protein LOC115724119 [Cannabis sativa]|uniref:uncharacterized protein LOC115724119 n=1 Tax=Cannabis sativa TaxID=3483 RepID=UPI0029CA6D5F|nr:uncharacterized protein LOC115724119 [Cannabis sativa]